MLLDNTKDVFLLKQALLISKLITEHIGNKGSLG